MAEKAILSKYWNAVFIVSHHHHFSLSNDLLKSQFLKFEVTEGIGSLFWILLCWNQGLTDSFFGPVVACLCLTAQIHWCSGACKASEQKLLSKKVNPSLSWQHRRSFKWMVAKSSSYSQFTAPVSTLKDTANTQNMHSHMQKKLFPIL